MTTDLDRRFRAADTLRAPELWHDIERRAEGPTGGPAHDSRRWLTIAVAAALSLGAFAGVWRAFNGNGHEAAGLQANGPIAFAKTVGTGPDGLAITQLWVRDPATGKTSQIPTGPGAVLDPVWSSDGSMVAYRRITTRIQTITEPSSGFVVHSVIEVAATDGSFADTLSACFSARCEPTGLSFSPDGTRLAWAANSSATAIRVADVRSGAVTTLCQSSCGRYIAELAWSPDGTRLAFSNTGKQLADGGPVYPSAIWVAAADGSWVQRLTAGAGCSPQERCTADRSPTWSPDGRSLVFLRTDEGRISQPTSLLRVRADGTGLHVLPACHLGSCVGPTSWSPDGSLLASVSGGAPWDPKRGSVALIDANTGAVLHRLHPASNEGCAEAGALTFSPDGSAVLVSSRPWLVTNLCVVPVDGAAPYMLAHEVSGSNLSSSAWLPGGSIDATAGPAPSAAPSTGGLVSHLSLPPGQIIFGVNHVRRQQPHGGTYRVGSDGGGFVRYPGCSATFSPDGRATACAVYAGTRSKIVAWRGGRPFATDAATPGYSYVDAPTWSPTGSLLAYTLSTSSEGHFAVSVRLFDTRTHSDRLLASDETSPTWSPDGTQIAATPPNHGFTEGRSEIDVISVPGGGKTPVIQLPGVVSDLAWSPDGQWIAFRWDTVTGAGIWLVHPDGTGLRLVPTATDASGGQMAWSPDSRYLVFGAGDDHLRRGLYAARISDGATMMLVRAQPGVGDVLWIPGSS